VFIVFFVAAVAGRRSFPELGVRLVTGFAFDFLGIGVTASQREVRLPMVESLLRNRRNILRTALMLRVAISAFPLFLETAVKSLLLIDILADVFMAVEAEDRLSPFVEPFMACGAGVFPLGMALDHLTGHQSRFDIFRLG
jgi:hypothetical protein